jgi:hypothetical protein
MAALLLQSILHMEEDMANEDLQLAMMIEGERTLKKRQKSLKSLKGLKRLKTNHKGWNQRGVGGVKDGSREAYGSKTGC